MARCFPENPDDLPPLAGAATNLWGLLRSLSDDWAVWIRLCPQADVQEFLLLHQERHPICLAHVSELSQLDTAAELLRRVQRQYHGCSVALVSKTLAAGGLFNKGPADISFLDKRDTSRPERFKAALAPLLPQAVSPDVVRALRAFIAPEVIVPAKDTSRRDVFRSNTITADTKEYALDYEQEAILKRDLILSREGTDAAQSLRARVITGVAGSGKSLVLIHRACLLRELNPDCTGLVLTHNRALKDDLRFRYDRIRQHPGYNMRWKTFQGFCLEILREFGHNINTDKDIISTSKRAKLIQAVHQKFFVKSAISWTMFRDEIDWFKDSLFESKNDYLDADRQGRGFGLTIEQREKMLDAMFAYHEDLQKTSYQYDWSSIPRELWREKQFLQQMPKYDAVLIDEAQFLPPIAYEIIKHALTPGGHILFSADPTQGFLKRRLSWLSMGVDIRGRSHRLRQCYRTTRGILEFARHFYQTRLGTEDPEVDLSDEQAMARMELGKPPLLVEINARQSATAWVLDNLVKLITDGVSPGDILLLQTDGWRVEEFASSLRKKLPQIPLVNLQKWGEAYTGKEIRICALEAATGLEAPIVYLLGAEEILQEEDDPQLAPEDKTQMRHDNTRKLYMGFTRASTRLIITLPKAYANKDWFVLPVTRTYSEPVSR